MCSAYKGASNNLCSAMASFGRLLATQTLPPDSLTPFTACRLIALDKNPGVRPIGVSEVLRRILAKSILRVTSDDVMEACGFLQKCSGLPAGIEAAVHAMKRLYEDATTEGVLLVDAKNAFNCLNRQAALHNVRHLCPSLATTLLNCYQDDARLFVSGGGELSSAEGTTQGDPLSMVFYALATLPFVRHLRTTHANIRQLWYADDSSGAGKLRALRRWWDDVDETGKPYGYHVNASKTLLLVKPDLLNLAHSVFAGTGIEVVTDGARYLGAAIGTPDFIAGYTAGKVQDWQQELMRLSEIATTEPHAAYAALTHGLRGRWTYLLRTLEFSAEQLQRLDDTVTEHFLPALTGKRTFTADDLSLLRLPCRLGGIGLPYFKEIATSQLQASQVITSSQVDEIIYQHDREWQHHSCDFVDQLARRERASAAKSSKKASAASFAALREAADRPLARRMDELSRKGPSSWLTALPLKEHGFHLSKQEFRDGLALRYDWPLLDVPTKCACGVLFSTAHAMCCPRGGFPTIRHNEVRDMVGELLTEVCHAVAIEPQLAPLSGEVFMAASTNTAEDARADVRARGFWTRAQDAFFDVRVFHPDAASYSAQPLDALLLQHERQKKLQYGERIVNVDRGTFSPLVLSTSGVAAPECERFLKRLCGLLARADSSMPYAHHVAYVRCRLSFALLRSAVMCVRGSRSAYHRPANELRELAVVESRI